MTLIVGLPVCQLCFKPLNKIKYEISWQEHNKIIFSGIYLCPECYKDTNMPLTIVKRPGYKPTRKYVILPPLTPPKPPKGAFQKGKTK